MRLPEGYIEPRCPKCKEGLGAWNEEYRQKHIKSCEPKTMHTPTAQELHLRSSLENEGYHKERIEEIVTRDNAHEELVNRLKDNTEALLDFHKEHPKLFGEFFGAHFVEMNEQALANAGVKL